MQKKRSGFLTFCFACLPGAGQMFLGFFKEGVSLMIAFFGLIGLTGWLNFEALSVLLPVIWFYAFFDSLNKNSLPDEEFDNLNDHYLFVSGMEDFQGFPFSRYRVIAAIVLILIGLNLLCNNLVDTLEYCGFHLNYEAHAILFSYIPQMCIAVLIIAAGLNLIIGKKNTLEQDLSEEEKGFLNDNHENQDENQGGGF